MMAYGLDGRKKNKWLFFIVILILSGSSHWCVHLRLLEWTGQLALNEIIFWFWRFFWVRWPLFRWWERWLGNPSLLEAIGPRYWLATHGLFVSNVQLFSWNNWTSPAISCRSWEESTNCCIRPIRYHLLPAQSNLPSSMPKTQAK